MAINANMTDVVNEITRKTRNASDIPGINTLTKNVEQVLGADYLNEILTASLNTVKEIIVPADTDTKQIELTEDDLKADIIVFSDNTKSTAARTVFTVNGILNKHAFYLTVGTTNFYAYAREDDDLQVLDRLASQVNNAANWSGDQQVTAEVDSDKLVLTATKVSSKYNFTSELLCTYTDHLTVYADINKTEYKAEDRMSRYDGVKIILPKTTQAFLVKNKMNSELMFTCKGNNNSADMIQVSGDAEKDAVCFVTTDGSKVYSLTQSYENTVCTNKGDMISHDGTSLVAVTGGQPGQQLQVKDGMPSWENQRGRYGETLYRGNIETTKFDPDYNVQSLAVPERKVENYGGFQAFNPHSQGESDQPAYSMCLYKTNDGLVRWRGNSTAQNCGQNTNWNYLGGWLNFPEEKMQNQEIAFVEAGYNYTFVVFEDGSVAVAGNNSNGANGVGHGSQLDRFTNVYHFDGSDPEHSCKQICLASTHDTGQRSTAFLTDSGHVYTCGSNSHGQLGNRRVSDTSIAFYHPRKVEGLENISKIWSGGGASPWYVAWDSVNEILWGWGNNQAGQFGVSTSAMNYFNPVKIPVNSSKTLKAVFCSGNSTSYNNLHLLYTDGTVWGAGSNNYGQLCNNSTTASTTFVQCSNTGIGTVIDGSADSKKVEKMWCTRNTTYTSFFCRMVDGSTVAWGYNGGYDFLNTGTTTADNYQTVSTNLVMLSNIKKMVHAGAQGNSTGICWMCLTDDNEVWTAGYNNNYSRGYGESGNPPTDHSFSWERVYAPSNDQFHGNIMDIQTMGYSNNYSMHCLDFNFEGWSWGYNGHYHINGQWPASHHGVPFKWHGVNY